MILLISGMKAAGQEFGAHTLSHPYLTRLSRQEQLQEIEDSKKLIENKLAMTVKHFCYPYQDFNRATEDLVQQAGYLTASYAPSHYNLAFFWDDAYALERISIFSEVGLAKFKCLVSGKYFRARKLLPGRSWQAVTAAIRKLNV